MHSRQSGLPAGAWPQGGLIGAEGQAVQATIRAMRLAAAAVLGVVTLASLTASQAQPAPAAQRPSAAAVPFKVGETLTYDVMWSSSLVAGSAVSTVGSKRASAGSTAYAITVEGRPLPMLSRLYNLFYKMDTLLDSVTLLPHQASLYTEEGASRRVAAVRFDRKARRAFYELQSETVARFDFDVPPQVQDGLSALFVLRAMTFKAGERITLPIVDRGALYQLQVEPVSRARVRVPLGDMDAWTLKTSILDADGQAAVDNAAVWISTDARRLPLKLQAELPVGAFVLALRDAR